MSRELGPRAGVGRALMDYLVARGAANGCYKMQLMSRKDRAEAHRLYSDLGLAPFAEGFRLYLNHAQGR